MNPNKLLAKAPAFYLFAILYFALGVYSPLKMVYINSICMSVINIIMMSISNLMINSALYLHQLLGV